MLPFQQLCVHHSLLGMKYKRGETEEHKPLNYSKPKNTILSPRVSLYYQGKLPTVRVPVVT